MLNLFTERSSRLLQICKHAYSTNDFSSIKNELRPYDNTGSFGRLSSLTQLKQTALVNSAHSLQGGRVLLDNLKDSNLFTEEYADDYKQCHKNLEQIMDSIENRNNLEEEKTIDQPTFEDIERKICTLMAVQARVMEGIQAQD